MKTRWCLSVCFHFSSVSTQRPAVSGLLHAALAHRYPAVGWPHSPGPGSHTEEEVRELQSSGLECDTEKLHSAQQSSCFRFMEDVPALLSRCFGKKSVSSE